MPTKKVSSPKDSLDNLNNFSELSSKLREQISAHHALLVVAGNSRKDITAQIIEDWTELSSDLVVMDVDQFTIDDSREIKKTASEKSFNETFRLFVISFSRITSEAQNALLKSVEDPSSSTKFIFVCEQVSALLPTFLSRVQKVIVSKKEGADKSVVDDAKEFISAPIKKRLALAKTYAEHVSDEKISRNYVADVIQEIIRQTKTRSKDLLDCAEYITDRSSSIKMILEHVALMI